MQKQVVVIEDIESVRALHVAFLRRFDCQVFEAAEGAAGLALVRAHRPALVLLDIMMPGMSGYEVIHAVRADPDPSVRATPIIMTTALAAREIVKSIMDLGVTGYLVKPIARTLFDREVTKVLGSPAATAGPLPHVLVADDSGRDLDRMRAALVGRARLLTATHGREAVERYREARPTMVFLSLGLSDPDGWQTLAAMRAIDANSGRYVALVPVGYPVDVALLHGSGFTSHVAKPIHAADIVNCLSAHPENTPASEVLVEWCDDVPVVVFPSLELVVGRIEGMTSAIVDRVARAGHDRVILDLSATRQFAAGVPRFVARAIAIAKARRLAVVAVANAQVATALATISETAVRYRETRRQAVAAFSNRHVVTCPST